MHAIFDVTFPEASIAALPVSGGVEEIRPGLYWGLIKTSVLVQVGRRRVPGFAALAIIGTRPTWSDVWACHFGAPPTAHELALADALPAGVLDEVLVRVLAAGGEIDPADATGPV